VDGCASRDGGGDDDDDDDERQIEPFCIVFSMSDVITVGDEYCEGELPTGTLWLSVTAVYNVS